MKRFCKYCFWILAVLCGITACNYSPKKTSPDEIIYVKKNQQSYPSVLEIILKSDTVNTDQLMEICRQYDIDSTAIYKWKNRLVIYDVFDDGVIIMDDLIATYSDGQSIKYFDIPYYIFDRKNCDDKETAPEWSHTIMTANLVANTVMQQEYMNYHATQTEEWPEVANGFCKADFQQLLMFRNDRQLMLIISIPKGENLDELNPKTTENNPRVDEWNAIMSKYQEGIEGSEMGNAWVTFSPLFK